MKFLLRVFVRKIEILDIYWVRRFVKNVSVSVNFCLDL